MSLTSLAPAVESAPRTALQAAVSRLTGVQILSTGAFSPPQVVTNADLAPLGFDADWIVQRTGILERRRAAEGMATSDLAYEAAARCLAAADVGPSEVDLIVLATMTPDSPTPSTACQVQRRLGGRAAAFDVSAACAGFMYALITGMQFVKTGSVRRVLVIGADVMTRAVNPADAKTYPLFGDGAGAVLLGAGSDEQGLTAFTLGADGSGAELLCTPGGGTREPLTAASLAAGRQFMQMEGRAVFKWAVNLVADSVRDVLAYAGLSAADLSLVILHQANRRILDAAAEHLGIPPEKLVVNLDRFGNTSAASIPLALDEVRRAGRVHPGDHLLLCGFGAGLAWGTGVLRW
ncbi:MAG: beta-ketoacyl-ACP synthase III [Pirellulaceae bacterium]|nr:beta-ketoacyl-ACP synthase III [Pirellulaceae bacterium]